VVDLVLEASDGHVARLAHEADPVRAIVELVWNSIDAEAWHVRVSLERDESLGGIVGVTVRDDGHGISVDEVTAAFGRIGDSWKSRGDRRSKNDVRGLHGSLGQGRLRAFALGSRVCWRSVSRDTSGALYTVAIDGRRTCRNVFEWDSSPAGDEPTGTVFTAANDEQRQLKALLPDAALPALRANFAPILLNSPDLVITYDGCPLDPSAEIADDAILTVPVELEGGARALHVRVIEWKAGTHRAIYYGRDAEHLSYEEDGSEVESQFPFSAYVSLPGLQDEWQDLVLGELAPDPVGAAWRATRHAVREHFADRRRRRRREQVAAWKNQGVYPYQGEPETETDRAERAVFDVVSGALSAQIPTRSRASARLTLTLLRDAIRHEPERLTAVLHEVVNLTPSDLEGLTRLLGETTLPAIIRSANVVASRNKFLLALNHLLFDPDDSPKVGERDHLHKILEHELWIFGEGYNMMSSERGLTQMLRTHLNLQGLPDKDIEPATRRTGRSGRVDLHLAVRAQEHDRTRHLIVELKAPDVTITRTELDQVEDYANVIVGNPRFATGGTYWDVILLGTDMDAVARNRITDPASGLFWAKDVDGGPVVRMYLRRWTDVLAENKRRLDFITSRLEHDPSTGESLDWVRQNYAQFLPDSILAPGSTEATAVGPGSEPETAASVSVR
jgi:histidine kinase/DNA gyrase B/HSP90-like ATPase